MGKRLEFSTRSFGSDGTLPDPGVLAGWVSQRRGQEGDLTTFLLNQELSFQKEAGITQPCAGGKFYFQRWQHNLGLQGMAISPDGVELDPDYIRETEEIAALAKGGWLAIPAPHLLPADETTSSDPDEREQTLFHLYKRLMRAGRDVHIGGHVLVGNRPIPDELEMLSGRKVFFFFPELNRRLLSILLEYQQHIAIQAAMLPILEDLMHEYDVFQIILLDPEESDLRRALSIREPHQIFSGGYCKGSCREYWKNLSGKSSFPI